jgi:hypothetical protein
MGDFNKPPTEEELRKKVPFNIPKQLTEKKDNKKTKGKSTEITTKPFNIA